MNERRQPPQRLNPEHRESPRFPVAAGVRILRAAEDGSDVIDGDVMEASLTGMRVVLDQPVRKNEQLLVEVTSEFHGGVNVTAQIMWDREHSRRVRCRQLRAPLDFVAHATSPTATLGRNGSGSVPIKNSLVVTSLMGSKSCVRPHKSSGR
jgi:hypothetical protein